MSEQISLDPLAEMKKTLLRESLLATKKLIEARLAEVEEELDELHERQRAISELTRSL